MESYANVSMESAFLRDFIQEIADSFGAVDDLTADNSATYVL